MICERHLTPFLQVLCMLGFCEIRPTVIQPTKIIPNYTVIQSTFAHVVHVDNISSILWKFVNVGIYRIPQYT